MALITSKWFVVPFIVIICVVITLWVLGKKSAHAEIVIPHEVGHVWQVLVDTSNYSAWNDTFFVIEGDLIEGTQIKYRFKQDENVSYDISTNVVNVVENQLLKQEGGTKGILTFQHQYILSPVEGGTKLVIHEEYRGIGVNSWKPTPVELAYKRLAKAIKLQVAKVHR